MSWQAESKKMAAGKWIKFSAETPIHIITFEGEPTKKEKTSTIQGKEGEVYYQMSFPVTEDGEERLLEPNMSLLRQIVAEDEVESIMGRTIMIKCLDPQKKQNWMLRPVGNNQTITRAPIKQTPKEAPEQLQRRVDRATVKVEPEDEESLKPEFDEEGREIPKRQIKTTTQEKAAPTGITQEEMTRQNDIARAKFAADVEKRRAKVAAETTEGITEEKEPDAKPRKRRASKAKSEPVEEAS